MGTAHYHLNNEQEARYHLHQAIAEARHWVQLHRPGRGGVAGRPPHALVAAQARWPGWP
ncbi:MAG: hypothetical protein HZY76_11565 [Anaerolineae bacterium]|nr:MAG: hypothetical protein HZY76_11565 [Anaerolineae bacterium]